MSNVIRGMIFLLKPVLYVLEVLTERLKPKNAEVMSREELTAFGQMVRESAMLRPEQAAIVGNALALDQVHIKSILTPRTVVFTLPAEGTVAEYRQQVIESNYSRIPLIDAETGEWDRFVIKVDVLACEDHEKTLGELSRKLPLSFATQSVTRLLRRTVREQLHILQVVNEFGDAIGIITLEDLLETVIGQEILDEHDEHSDLQAVAIEQTRQRMEEEEK